MTSIPQWDAVLRAPLRDKWETILFEFKSVWTGEDATHRVSLLKSAQKTPLSVSPGTSVQHAVTLMMENDYSQLPVLQDEKTVKGMFSWRSYGKRMAMAFECSVVDEAMEPAQVLDLDAWLFEAFAAVAKSDAVLIQNKAREICGIVTAYDVSETFGTLVEPFLLIEEIEKHLRALLKDHVSEDDLKKVIPSKTSANTRLRITDLNFGGYVALLKEDRVWDALRLKLDRRVFVQSVVDAKSIRNDVMHFRPLGIGAEKLTKLRNFAKFLREIRILRKAGKKSESKNV